MGNVGSYTELNREEMLWRISDDTGTQAQHDRADTEVRRSREPQLVCVHMCVGEEPRPILFGLNIVFRT